MKVNKKIYDWYQQVFKGENDNEKELLLIAVLQQGWAQQYNDESTAYMDKFLNLGEYDLEIAYFINRNKMEFVDAILHDNVELDEPLMNWRLKGVDLGVSVFVDEKQTFRDSLRLDTKRYAKRLTRNEMILLLERVDNGMTIDMFEGVEEWKNY